MVTQYHLYIKGKTEPEAILHTIEEANQAMYMIKEQNPYMGIEIKLEVSIVKPGVWTRSIYTSLNAM